MLCLIFDTNIVKFLKIYVFSCVFFSCLLSSYRHVPCSICQCLIKPFHPWSPANILYCIQPHLWPPTSRRTLLLWASLSLYSLSTHAWWVLQIIFLCFLCMNTQHFTCWVVRLHMLHLTIATFFGTLILSASTEGRKWSWPKRGPAPIRELLLPSLSSPTSAASFSALTVSSSRASASRASLWSGKKVSERPLAHRKILISQ